MTLEHNRARNANMVAMSRKGMTLRQIGNIYGVSHELVRLVLLRYGIKSQSPRPYALTAKEVAEAFALYVSQTVTQAQVARQYGVTVRTLERAFDRYGLNADANKRPKPHDMTNLAERYAHYMDGMTYQEIADICGLSSLLCVMFQFRRHQLRVMGRRSNKMSADQRRKVMHEIHGIDMWEVAP